MSAAATAGHHAARDRQRKLEAMARQTERIRTTLTDQRGHEPRTRTIASRGRVI